MSGFTALPPSDDDVDPGSPAADKTSEGFELLPPNASTCEQEQTALPTFTVVKKCMVRAEYDTRSAEVGLMEVGTVFVALESRTDDDGWQRVRLDRGWVTAAGPTGVYARAGSKDPNECALILLSRRPGLALRVRLAS